MQLSRLWGRAVAPLALCCLLAPSVWADGPAKPEAKSKKAKTDSTDVATTDAQPAKDATSATAARAATPAKKPAQGARGAGASNRASRGSEAPVVTPVPATTGTLGLFTVESGETLPTKGLSFSTYVNKFSRMPGSVTVLNLGWNFGVGVRDWLTFYAALEPYRHTHIGNPSQLSLRTPTSDTTNPPFPNAANRTIYRRLGVGLLPGYVEDYPLAANNDGGFGEVVLGFKLGILSEKRGNPVSFGIRNDFIIPTRTTLQDLLDNGTQSGQFNFATTVSLSKTWSNVAMLAANWGWRFTRDPRSSLDGSHLMAQADQMRVGVGFLLFPESRFQLMNEYTGVVFQGTHTPNTSFGARDPVDGVWGVRLYPWRSVALDVGYRYMLNLRNAHDRHGFVVKLGAVYWPEKAAPVNHPPVASCSADKSSVYVESGDTVTVRVQASDPDNDPLNYSWTATGGRVDGTGMEVRWNSAGTAAGTYTITARVDDGRGGTASCSVDVNVEKRPNRPPTMSCSVDRSSVLAGERVRVNAVASDPDNDPLSYSWRANGGQIVGSGASVQLDTTGLAPGRYTVTGRVDDGRGGAADCSVDVDVQSPPAPPQASKLNECFFRAGSARVDNVCKRILDDVALRLKNEPKATVVVVAYSDPKEPKKLAQQRGDNTAKYIAGKGVDLSRLNVRTAGGQAGGDKQNRRIDLIWVPEGATY